MELKELIEEYGGCESNADELYSALFRIGEHCIEQTAGKDAKTTFKGNPIIYEYAEQEYNGKCRRYILLEDTLLDQIHAAQKYPSNLLNACTYYGKKKDSTRMDKCFGLIFDLDSVDERCVNNLLFQCRSGACPMPNYVVVSKSGVGLHLYYLFDRPLRMYPQIKVELKELKYELTKRVWNVYTSKKKTMQFQSFDQSFMVAGSKEVMKVYKIHDRRWSVDELSEIAHYDFKWNKYKPTTYTKEESKEMFPKWYEDVVILGKKRNGRWTDKRDLYNWWLRTIKEGAVYGTRYWCVMCLVIYAVKSGVPKKEVKKDIEELVPLLNSKADADHPFTQNDIKSALESYDDSFVKFPIKSIERHSQIPIKRNKRNYRKQAEHLKRARAVQQVDYPNGEWRFTGSKPKHKEAIERYFEEHPEATVSDCASDLNIARSTVYRWREK